MIVVTLWGLNPSPRAKATDKIKIVTIAHGVTRASIPECQCSGAIRSGTLATAVTAARADTWAVAPFTVCSSDRRGDIPS